jgi:hypothetical protein
LSFAVQTCATEASYIDCQSTALECAAMHFSSLERFD